MQQQQQQQQQQHFINQITKKKKRNTNIVTAHKITYRSAIFCHVQLLKFS